MQAIDNGQNVREHLIELKKQLKEASYQDAFLSYINWDMDWFRRLLAHEDAKVRKNVIQIIGLCELDGLADDLFAAYEAEQTLYLRAEYLSVLKDMDVTPYLTSFEERLNVLQRSVDAGDNEKHISAELRALTAILRQSGRIKEHTFIGEDTMSVMILTTLSGKEAYLKRALDEVLGEGKTKLVRGGVRVTTSDYGSLSKVRCYQEILHVVPNCQNLTGSPKDVAERVVGQGLLSYLDERISGTASYRFRVQVRGMMEEKERLHLTKVFCEELERASKHQLVNAPSDYEMEFRFHKSSKAANTYSLYLKLNLLEDTRFAYREHAVATSIQPYVAAMTMEVAKDVLAGRGQILDPFCGVGTMLVERNYQEHSHSLYGVDIYGQAILWAQQQNEKARMDIHYIHKDMADFTHKYLFEAVITNPPAVSAKMPEKEIAGLYLTFLNKCEEWLTADGVVVLYCQSPAVMERAVARQNGFRIEKCEDMYKKGKSKVLVLVRR